MRFDGPTIFGAVLLMGFGAAIALLVGGGRCESEPAPGGAVAASARGTPPTPPEPPALRGTAEEVDPSRVDALEETIDDLRAEIATLRAELETARNAGQKPKAPGPEDPDRELLRAVGGHWGEGLVLDVADRLALEGGRRAAFLQAVRDVEKKVQDLEVRNATRTREGDKTTVKIASFGEDGRRLRKEWAAWVDRNLSAEERRRYADQDVDDMLWRGRIEHAVRTIVVDPGEGGTLSVGEEIEDGHGSRSNRVSSGTDRDRLLAPYRHLLP